MRGFLFYHNVQEEAADLDIVSGKLALEPVGNRLDQKTGDISRDYAFFGWTAVTALN